MDAISNDNTIIKQTAWMGMDGSECVLGLILERLNFVFVGNTLLTFVMMYVVVLMKVVFMLGNKGSRVVRSVGRSVGFGRSMSIGSVDDDVGGSVGVGRILMVTFVPFVGHVYDTINYG